MTPTTLDGALRRSADGYAARFTREYATGAGDLWDALTTPERLARWLAPVSGDLRPGGTAQVHFDDGVATFDVQQCDPPRSLRARWVHDRDRSSSVTAVVEPLGEARSRLVLDHDGLTTTQAPEYAAGWHWHLDALGADVEDAPAPPWDDVFDAARARYRAQLGGDHT